MASVRVGEPGALVKPGDPIPGQIGRYYEAGQYAPSVEHLTSIKLQEMNQAGLLPRTGLDIYDENGNISEAKIKDLDIKKELKKYNIHSYSDTLPHFAFVGLASVLYNIDEDAVRYIDISRVEWVGDVNLGNHNMSLMDQAEQFSDVVTTTDRNLISAYARQGTNFHLVLFQPFFVYLSVPIVPAIKNVSSGLNLASVSVLKTIGYMIYEKIKLVDKAKYVELLNSMGWKQKNSIPANEQARFVLAGSEIGMPRGKSWYRDMSFNPVSTSATLSPKECFSELFLYYYVHRMYLNAKQPSYVSFMNELVEYLGNM